jgi:hypothetical protein
MKTRSGFVSNSSSSSFIIALKQTKEVCPHCGRSDPDFLDLIEGMGNSGSDYESTQLISRSSQDLESSWADQYVKRFMTDNQDVIEKAKLLESEGWTIAHIEVSYHDQPTHDIMSSLDRSGNLKVLWDSES